MKEHEQGGTEEAEDTRKSKREKEEKKLVEEREKKGEDGKEKNKQIKSERQETVGNLGLLQDIRACGCEIWPSVWEPRKLSGKMYTGYQYIRWL